MSKLERLNARVAKLLTEAVQEVLELVKETVCEYQQRTFRTQRENESLKRQLQELQVRLTKENTGGLDVVQSLQDVLCNSFCQKLLILRHLFQKVAVKVAHFFKPLFLVNCC